MLKSAFEGKYMCMLSGCLHSSADISVYITPDVVIMFRCTLCFVILAIRVLPTSVVSMWHLEGLVGAVNLQIW